MQPFLRQVARAYVSHHTPEELIDFCFVFPNKRSAAFFSHYFQDELTSQAFSPEITNITDFVSGFSSLSEASRYDMLFTLFDRYRSIPGVDTDFDRFLFWGEMLIGDFNDVDQYLVDAEALFTNIKRLREISANYLSPRQIDVIKRFWGEDRTHDAVDRFWKHLDSHPDAPSHTRFVKLWEVLLPLYRGYHESLATKGLATPGMFYRHAAEALDTMDSHDLPFKRVIFVGFNVLTTSEIQIFSALQKLGVADFYWDFNSEAFNIPENTAAKFIRRNAKEFPSAYPLDLTANPLPHINIVGVPSNIGQTHTAAAQLSKWIAEGQIANLGNAIDTAIVLPEEALFIPMVHAMPQEITAVNVTMGLPMRLSPVSAMIGKIISLQIRRRLKDGVTVFFYDDVNAILTTTAIRSVSPAKCALLEKTIVDRRLFNIPASLIIDMIPELQPIFDNLPANADHHAIYSYLASLCDFLLNSAGSDDSMHRQFIESYRDAIDKLYCATRDFDINMRGEAFLRMVERSVSSDTIRFSGEPLKGLQIMGVLETRALDFKNVIILSMNERSFPRRHYNRSFIPDALRHGFGMSTGDFQESIFAYYFYRLLSRAKNVTLLYDARSVGGIKSSEMSRYCTQLLYFFPQNTSLTLKVYDTLTFDSHTISASKTPRVLNILQRFTDPDPERGKNLSASALNTYLNCQLKFYFQYIEGYAEEAEITDFMDAGTYGQIVHAVAQRVYQNFQPDTETSTIITRHMLEPLTKFSDTTVNRMVVEEINMRFNHIDPTKGGDINRTLVGEALVLGKVISATMKAMLRQDLDFTPFTFIAAEKEMKGQVEIDGSLKVNFKQIVDRIDCVSLPDGSGQTIRFVDYKTGSETLKCNDIDGLFFLNDNRPKAIFQLLLYCHIYRMLQADDRPIWPVVYPLLSISATGIPSITIGDKCLTDYHLVYADFQHELNETIKYLFNPDIPFVQTSNPENCRYCQFLPLCKRELPPR